MSESNNQTNKSPELQLDTAETDRESEQSHTFRARRLSYTKHNLATNTAAAAAVGEGQGDESSDVNVNEEVNVCKDTVESTEHEEKKELADDNNDALVLEQEEEEDDDDNDALVLEQEGDTKSKTFRKRRLSLTKHHLKVAAVAPGDDEDSAVHNHNDEEPSAKRLRLALSKDSTTGKQQQQQLQSRIMHASELLQKPMRIAAAALKRSKLYHGPFSQQTSPPESPSRLPAWRVPRTRRHSFDDSKLPFPRHIVGTYSCHGVEPVYDSDYEHDDDDDENTTGGDDSASDNQKQQQRQVAKINQDRGGVAFPYGNCEKTALFACYDGHGQGGELVSQYALHHVQRRLERHPKFQSDIAIAMKETFTSVDEDLTLERDIEPLYAGTTACVALLRESILTIANAGDSRAVLARRTSSHKSNNGDQSKWEAIDLSVDNNPDVPDEQARIEAAGGFVSPPPEPGLSARVWLDEYCTQIGLAMSRSIGDHVLKPVGVIAEPVVTQHAVQANDDFVILASDGVFEFLSSDDAVKIVGEHVETDKGAARACQALIEAAANKWHEEEGDYRDDITALVIRLQHLWNTPLQQPQDGNKTTEEDGDKEN